MKHLASSSASSFTQNSLCPLFSSGSFRDFRRHRGTRLVVRADSVSAFFNISFDGLLNYCYLCSALFNVMMLVLFCFLLAQAVTFCHMQDYYSVLGVSRNASKSEIKSGKCCLVGPLADLLFF